MYVVSVAINGRDASQIPAVNSEATPIAGIAKVVSVQVSSWSGKTSFMAVHLSDFRLFGIFLSASASATIVSQSSETHFASWMTGPRAWCQRHPGEDGDHKSGPATKARHKERLRDMSGGDAATRGPAQRTRLSRGGLSGS
jgi:hypothetical protein